MYLRTETRIFPAVVYATYFRTMFILYLMSFNSHLARVLGKDRETHRYLGAQ